MIVAIAVVVVVIVVVAVVLVGMVVVEAAIGSRSGIGVVGACGNYLH